MTQQAKALTTEYNNPSLILWSPQGENQNPKVVFWPPPAMAGGQAQTDMHAHTHAIFNVFF